MDHERLILSYSEYIEGQRAYPLGSNGVASSYPMLYGETRLFYRRLGLCPFCCIEAPVADEERSFVHNPWARVHDDFKVWQCECGWWQGWTSHYDPVTKHETRERIFNGVLRTFDWSDAATPISVLREALKKRPRHLGTVNPKSMELLVQSVFSDFFDCEVHHCGKSHDGGIDLLFVLADRPIAVQVKRRANPKSVEPVSSIREFLGAILLEGISSGFFVSTADRFSKPADRAARNAINLGLVERFQLVDGHRLLSMLDLVQKDDGSKPWQQLCFLRRVLRHEGHEYE